MTTIRVLAAVITRDGRYLVCRRAAHKRHGRAWEFPGGKLEPGESLLAAARRELAEELKVQVITVGPELHSEMDPGSPYRIEFVAVEIQGEPQCLEHEELRWVGLAELGTLELAPADRQFAHVLGGEERE